MQEAGLAITTETLLGRWAKATADACADRYPPGLEFRPGGVYLAPEGPEAGSLWHGGEWRVEAPDTLVVQAANDASLRYRIAAADADAFTVIDEAACRVTYRRI